MEWQWLLNNKSNLIQIRFENVCTRRYLATIKHMRSREPTMATLVYPPRGQLVPITLYSTVLSLPAESSKVIREGATAQSILACVILTIL